MIRRLFLCFALLLAGCGDTTPSDGGDGSEGDGGGDISCEVDDDCSGWEICEDAICEDGDRNNSIEEAVTLAWEEETEEYINPKEDVDYFTFNAAGGEYVKITTVTDDADSNTVLTLRDTNLKVLTSSDEYPNGADVSTYDSVIYAYLAEAGTYVIEVEDDGTFYDDADHSTDGGRSYTYTLLVTEYSRHTDEVGTYSSPSPELDIADGNSIYAVGVVLEEEGDADYIGVTMPYGNTGMSVSGVVDLQGSDASPLVELYDSDGQLLSAKAGVGPDGVLYYPAMEPGYHVLVVRDENGGGGSSYWTYLFVQIGSEGAAYATEEESNDTLGTANELSMTEGSGSAGDYIVGHAQGWADGPGGVDWFSFPGFDDGNTVACVNGTKWGSSVPFSIELFDASKTSLASDDGDEDDDPNAATENAAVDDSTYYLAVTAPEDASGGLDEWYRITVYVADFEIGSFTCP